jgi:hypothetical protein
VEQKALPAPEKKPKDYLTATDIGEHPSVQKSAHEVNMFLYQYKPPFLIKDQNGEWRLTEYGKEYGEERIRELLGGAFVWRIHWKKDILRLFNVYDHEEMGFVKLYIKANGGTPDKLISRIEFDVA